MPTAIVSSVKQPCGIYLAAGQWTKIKLSPCFECPLLMCALSCLSSLLFYFGPAPPAHQTSILKSSLSLRRFSWSAALQAGGVILCETCLINEDPDLCYGAGGWAWSSSEAKSPPLIVPHLRANKRPRSLILLEMDYHPLCILLHPSTVFSRLSLPLSHVCCFSFLFLLQSVSR